MAKWSKIKVNPEQINNGNEYTVNDNVSVEALNGIINNSFKAQQDAEQALELATGANKANGTVVEINGEPQGTWDATFAEELRNESINLFNISNISKTINGVTITINKGVIKVVGIATAPVNEFIKLNKHFIIDTYTIYDNHEATLQGERIFLTKEINDYTNRFSMASITTINPTFDINYLHIYVPKETNINQIFSPMVVKGTYNANTMPSFQQYNPNRHITNSEAEFLKEEHEKSTNLAQVNTSKTWNFGLKAKIESGKTYTVSIKCNQLVSFNLKKENTFGAIILTQWDCNWRFTHTFVADWTGDLFVNTSNGTPDYTEIMVNNGDPLPYQPYNSSSHITNAQADLLKHEEEKSKNLFEGSVLEIGTISSEEGINAAANHRIRTNNYIPTTKDNYNELSFEGLDEAVIFYYDSNKVYIQRQTWTKSVVKLEVPNNCAYVRFAFRYSDDRVISSTDELKNVEFSKEGEIIHEKDIKPVLAWENATPSSGIGYASNIALNIGNVFDYKLGYLEWYISTNINSLAPVTTRIEFMPNKNNYFRLITAIDDKGSIATRTLAITVDGTLLIQNCFVGGAEDNQKIIPFKFYVSNY